MNRELRLGNYVMDRGGKVIRIDFFEHLETDNDCKFGQKMFIGDQEVHPLTEYTSHAKHIPLTPEWLERFGFELDKEQECYIICVDEYWCYLLIDANDMSAAIQSTTEEKTGIAVCLNLPLTQYVHQIQNLFYSLSGEELTYNDGTN